MMECQWDSEPQRYQWLMMRLLHTILTSAVDWQITHVRV